MLTVLSAHSSNRRAQFNVCPSSDEAISLHLVIASAPLTVTFLPRGVPKCLVAVEDNTRE